MRTWSFSGSKNHLIPGRFVRNFFRPLPWSFSPGAFSGCPDPSGAPPAPLVFFGCPKSWGLFGSSEPWFFLRGGVWPGPGGRIPKKSPSPGGGLSWSFSGFPGVPGCPRSWQLFRYFPEVRIRSAGGSARFSGSSREFSTANSDYLTVSIKFDKKR